MMDGGGAGTAPPLVRSELWWAVAVLAAVLVVPTLLVTWGRWQGEVVWTSYREPKLAALLVATVVLVAAVIWRRTVRPSDLLLTVFRPAVGLLLLLVGWCVLTLLWAPVAEHVITELVEWAPALVFVILGVAWARRQPAVLGIVLGCILAAAGLCTAVGWVQLAVPIDVLLPIRPEAGVSAPSLMGYRNPMAHLMTGQLLVACGLLAELLRQGRVRVAGALAVVIALEAGYLAQLQSRTAMVAVAVGLSAFLLGVCCVARGERWKRWVVLSGLAIGLVLVVMISLQPAARGRAASLLTYVSSPSLYLQSDRGVYAANTVEMVLDRPLGAGAGNWFVLYPVYRVHGRDVGFLEHVQVRRAHSDHIQMLGELGWAGAALWLGFVVAVTLAALRGVGTQRSPLAVAVAAQWLAMLATMATDYAIELPVLRVQMAAVVVLVLGTGRSESVAEEAWQRTRASWLATGAVVCCLVVVVALAVHLVERDAAFHRAHALYDVLMAEMRSAEVPLERQRVYGALAPEIRDAADEWASRPGLDTSAVMLPALMTDVELIGGRLGRALEWADRTLALHPYYPNIVRTLAVATRPVSPDRARLYTLIWRHLLDSDSPGYGLPIEPRAVAELSLDEVRALLAAIDVNRSTPPSSVIQSPGMVGARPSSSPVTTIGRGQKGGLP